MKKSRAIIILSVVSFLWIAVVSGLTWWNIVQLRQASHERNLTTARALFDIILSTQEWNSRLGGVYVSDSDAIQPGQSLDAPDQDILSADGVMLTKIDHANMARLLSEIAEENKDITYHIASMDPIRPENAPDGWEKLALSSFEDGVAERFVWDEQNQTVRYMAPLYVDEGCLACHEERGYQVGDVRGGISLSFPAQPAVGIPSLLGYIGVGVFGLTGILVSGTWLIRAFAKLEKESEFDRLNQVYNRSHFDSQFHQEFLRTRRMRIPLSILICDIDKFKAYNDAYGHQAGDACLETVAQALQKTLHRPGDLVARYGNDEFGIILPNTGHKGALTVAKLLRANIEALKIEHRSNQASKYVTISLGVATYDGEIISQMEFLKKADRALNLAKKKGGNHIITTGSEIT